MSKNVFIESQAKLAEERQALINAFKEMITDKFNHGT